MAGGEYRDQGRALQHRRSRHRRVRATPPAEATCEREAPCFVGLGWARFVLASPTLLALSVCISNFHDEGGQPLAAARADFRAWVRVLQPDEGGFLFPAGQPIGSDGQATLTQRLAHGRRR